MSHSSPTPLYFSLDDAGTILSATPAVVELLGQSAGASADTSADTSAGASADTSADTVVGRSLLDWVHPEDRVAIAPLFGAGASARLPGTSVSVRLQISTAAQADAPKSKEQGSLLQSGFCGVQLTFHGLQTSSSPQILAMAQIQESLAKRADESPAEPALAPISPIDDIAICKTIINELPNGSLLLFDQDLRYVRVGGQGLNQARSFFHYQEIEGKTLQETVSPDLYAQLEPLYRSALAGLEQVLEVQNQDQTYRMYGFPLRSGDRQAPIQYGLVLSQDISSLRQVEQALTYQAEAERQHRLVAQTSAEFSRHIRHSLDLNNVLQTAVDQVYRLLEVDRVFIYRIYPDKTGAVLTESVSTPELSVQQAIFTAEVFLPICYDFYQSAQVQAINDTTIEEVFPCSPGALNGTARAALIVPILQQNEPWGLLVAHQQTNPRVWQDWEVDLMRQLAGQLEIAVYQSELYSQVQQLNADLERQISLRTKQLQQAYDFEATLKRITDKVRDSLNEDQILEAAVREVTVVLQVSGCNASMYDIEAGTSTVRYEYTTTNLPYHGRVVQLDAFPEAYTMLLEGQPIQFCSLIPNPIRGTVATLAVPILDENGVLGDLWLINHREYAFSEQDIRLVQQVANQCAIALRQARLYQASMRQVRELEKLNQLKDDFLSTVSHELRTPMSNVKMAIQMLGILLRQDGSAESRTARIERYLQILHEESQREINLINDLLDLSRLDSGGDELQFSAIALPQWMPSFMRIFEEQAKNHQQFFQWTCPDNLPMLTTDASKLERILTELLGNAFKYTPAHETITVIVRPILHKEAIQISVTNTGVEIPEAEQERIFEKFYRIPNNDPWQHGGTGLGLALVRQMVQRMGSNLTVCSGNGQTRFTLQVPMMPPSSGLSSLEKTSTQAGVYQP